MAAKRRTATTRRKTRNGDAATETEGLVVYVHGIGPQKAPDELKTEWDLALFGSDQGDTTRMAYWSDILHPARVTPMAARKMAGVGDGRELDRDDLSDILKAARLNPSNKGARQFVSSVIDSFAGSQPAVAGARKKVLPIPGVLRRPISKAFLKAFIADTAAYFFNDDIRKGIKARLETALPIESGRPITLVAHSQGTIVALEVLSKLARRVNIVRLVTLGSPLGIQEVQDFLDVPPKQKPFAVPQGIDQWTNFSDPLDPVALDKGLNTEFEFRIEIDAETSADRVIVDEIIVNDHTRRFVGFNPHSAVGYLAHPKVRRAVSAAAQRDTMARFILARDVAESLVADQRHPLLIEVLEPGYAALNESPEECAKREQEEQKKPRRVRLPPSEAGSLLLADRIARAADEVAALVKATAKGTRRDPARELKAARVDRLRRFVAARLTPGEIQEIAVKHKQFNVYAVWKSASKRKLIFRSRAVLQADAALESYGARGRGITWAVLDTGVRSDHPHFSNQTISAIWDCTRTGPPVRLDADRDRDGHGSHVAGIIAGAHPERPNFMGVAPFARLVVYKVLNDQGEGEDAWIIKALDHIAEQNENKAAIAIHGLNLSLGGPYDSTVYGCGFTPICQELRRLWRSGVLVVVASGNEGQLEVQTSDGDVEINTPMSIGDPANLDDCIAVGSVNADRPHLYGVSAFSSRGPTSDGRPKPDVVAPGERIHSVNARFAGRQAQEPYRVESGTSMAAPHVSGLLAAFLSVRREFRGRPDEVKKILLDTCTDIGRDRYHQGRGIPNLMKMLLSV
ncbi:MAG: S8 family serine peptidase [Vicinamibacterales bacterium]